MKSFWGPRLAAAIAVVCLLAFPGVVAAQYTTVSAAHLGGTQTPMTGTIYWQTIVPARIGSSGGQMVSGMPAQAVVTTGAFSLSLPDALQASPNICYAVTGIDGTTGAILFGAGLAASGQVKTGGAYGCVQPTGTTWSFDSYQPPATPPVIYEPVPGPQGPAGAGYINGLSSDGLNGIRVADAVTPGDLNESALPAPSSLPGAMVTVKDLINPGDCSTGGGSYPAAWPCVSDGTNWYSPGGLPSVSVPVPVRRSLFNSALASLKSALSDEFHQYVKVDFLGDSITWGLYASGIGPQTPRAHLLTDVRDVLTSNSWVNQIRNYLGRTYFGGSVTAEMGATIASQTAGSGYSGTGTCTVNGGTYSTQATCTATVSGGGLSFSITNPGDYTVAPTSISFSGFTGGSGASASVGTAGNGVGHFTRQVYIAMDDPHFSNVIGTGCIFAPVTNTGFLQGTAEDITGTGCGIKFSFYGDNFTLVYTSLNHPGAQYDLYVDGVDQGSFAADNGSVQFGLTRTHTFTAGQHTIQIVNTSSNSYQIRLEGFEWSRTLRVANNGIIGTATTEWLSTGGLLTGAVQSDDEFDFVSLDTNDRSDTTYAPYSTSKVRANLDSIVSWLQGQGKKVVLTQVNNTGQETSSCAQAISGAQRFCQLDGANATRYVADLLDVDMVNQYPGTSQYYNWHIPCVLSSTAPHPIDGCEDLMFSNLITAIESSTTQLSNFTGSETIPAALTFTSTTSFGATSGGTQLYLYDTAVTSANVSVSAHSNSGSSGSGTILDYNYSSGTQNGVRYSRTQASPFNLQLLYGSSSPVLQLSNNASSFMSYGLCLGQASCSQNYGLTVNSISSGQVQLTLLDGGFSSSSLQVLMQSNSSNDVNYYINPMVSGSTGAAYINLFRSTNTAGTRQLRLFKGNNTSTVTLTLDAINGGVTPSLYTVATLPSCGSGNRGQQVEVSDASSPTFLTAPTGGGSSYSPVMCGGSGWVAF